MASFVSPKQKHLLEIFAGIHHADANTRNGCFRLLAALLFNV